MTYAGLWWKLRQNSVINLQITITSSGPRMNFTIGIAKTHRHSRDIKYRNKSFTNKFRRQKTGTRVFLLTKYMLIYFVPCKVIDTVASKRQDCFWITKYRAPPRMTRSNFLYLVESFRNLQPRSMFTYVLILLISMLLYNKSNILWMKI